MKKLISSIFTLLTMSLLIAACSGDSYEKRLKKEKKAINNYLADNGIVVLKEYPKDHKFAENEFYLEGSTGVYMRVVKLGAEPLVAALESDDRIPVDMRFDSITYLVSDKTIEGNNSALASPMRFTYGMPSTYIVADGNYYPLEYNFMSPACVLPLEKGVRSGGIVDLIVPFLNGSTLQRSTYEPIRFTRIHYTYFKQIDK